MQDLEGVDLEMYKSLGFVLENNVEQFLDEVFAEEVDYFGHTKTVELKPGGLDIKLTEANKHEYVTLKAQSHMTTKIADQLKSFLEGFWDIIPKVRIFYIQLVVKPHYYLIIVYHRPFAAIRSV